MTRRALLLGLVAAPALALAAPTAAAFRDRDCKDFKSQKKAQKFYKKQGGPKKDPHRLDADRDGKACEDYPYKKRR